MHVHGLDSALSVPRALIKEAVGLCAQPDAAVENDVNRKGGTKVHSRAAFCAPACRLCLPHAHRCAIHANVHLSVQYTQHAGYNVQAFPEIDTPAL
eukprot:98520-Rhodomonas_salina.2